MSQTARQHLANRQDAARASDAARLANELQALGATRTAALREAERLQRAHGLGLTLNTKPATK